MLLLLLILLQLLPLQVALNFFCWVVKLISIHLEAFALLSHSFLFNFCHHVQSGQYLCKIKPKICVFQSPQFL